VETVNDGSTGEEIKDVHQGGRFRTVNFRELATGAGHGGEAPVLNVKYSGESAACSPEHAGLEFVICTLGATPVSMLHFLALQENLWVKLSRIRCGGDSFPNFKGRASCPALRRWKCKRTINQGKRNRMQLKTILNRVQNFKSSVQNHCDSQKQSLIVLLRAILARILTIPAQRPMAATRLQQWLSLNLS